MSSVQGIGILSSSNLWAAAGPGVMISANGGRSWRVVSVEGSPAWFDDLASFGASDLWFATNQFVGDSAINPNKNDGGIRAEIIGRSTNNGRLWRVIGIPVSQLSDITLDFVNQSDGFAISGSNATGVSSGTAQKSNVLFGTTDGGASWHRIASVPTEGPVDFVTRLDGWALPIVPQGIGKPGLLHTTDGGLTWRPVIPTPPGDVASFTAAPHFFDASDGIATAEVSRPGTDTPSYVVYVTTNGGRTWSARPIPHLAGFQPELSSISHSTWVVTTTSRIYRTNDAGASWTSIKPVSATYANPQSVVFSTVNDGIAEVNNRLLHTSDGGRHWELVTAKAVTTGPVATIINEFPGSR